MNQWFSIKIAYHKEVEGGKIQKLTEQYLFDALTYGEVEQRVGEELAASIRFEFNLVNISKINIHDVFYFEQGDKWYKCKLAFAELDEQTGKERKVTQNMLVYAFSVEEAYVQLNQALSQNGLKFFEINAVELTKIADVFEYGKSVEQFSVPKPLMAEQVYAIEEVQNF